jgi:hypothetical protein
MAIENMLHLIRLTLRRRGGVSGEGLPVQAVAGIPELLASVDASCSVILHHMDHMSAVLQQKEEEQSPALAELPLSTPAWGPSPSF